MPAGIDPIAIAWSRGWRSVARLAGVIFFVGFQAAEYHMLGYFDLVFFVPEAVLLARLGPALRAAVADRGRVPRWIAARRLRISWSWPPLGGLFDLQPLLPRGTGAVFRVRRGALPVRLDRHRSRAGRARTGSGWCCRASFRSICPRPAATRRSACSRRDGHEMPIGLSKVTVGFPRVGINCAMCHAASFRAQAGRAPTIYPAAASHQTGEQEYLRFLIACASDPRFTADTILGEIARNTRLSFDGSAAVSLRDHPRHPSRAPAPAGLERLDDHAAGLGPRADRSVQPGEVHDAEAADRRHDRQLRHDAALEPDGAVRARRTTGTD